MVLRVAASGRDVGEAELLVLFPIPVGRDAQQGAETFALDLRGSRHELEHALQQVADQQAAQQDRAVRIQAQDARSVGRGSSTADQVRALGPVKDQHHECRQQRVGDGRAQSRQNRGSGDHDGQPAERGSMGAQLRRPAEAADGQAGRRQHDVRGGSNAAGAAEQRRHDHGRRQGHGRHAAGPNEGPGQDRRAQGGVQQSHGGQDCGGTDQHGAQDRIDRAPRTGRWRRKVVLREHGSLTLAEPAGP